MSTSSSGIAEVWIEVDGKRLEECSDGTSIAILEYDERPVTPYEVHIKLKKLPNPKSCYWAYRFYVDGKEDPGYWHVRSTTMKAVHDTFGGNGDLLGFKNVRLETDGNEGNATAETLTSLGEIRVEIFDTRTERKWREARGASGSSAPTEFVGESVSITEGAKAKQFSAVSVSSGKKAGFEHSKSRAAGYYNVVSLHGPCVDNLRLKYSRRFALVVRKILKDKSQEEERDSGEDMEAFLARRREKKRQREAAERAKAEAAAAARAAAAAMKEKKGTGPMPSGAAIDLTLSDSEDEGPPVEPPPTKVIKREGSALSAGVQ
eukprot:CAMPEP_0118927458 /NCGR_PEP_ID=MMETSP1169-20130426/4925_1 /TAXON_ID=36882 /ORGANISM="Pyramimonas obovata, Strain CCMP722" /LENGTH=318 /DNA_ID=CAMNT_0006869217 /DNA_START=84 /DNA_END=1040 /DNA_ORIENTATION=-